MQEEFLLERETAQSHSFLFKTPRFMDSEDSVPLVKKHHSFGEKASPAWTLLISPFSGKAHRIWSARSLGSTTQSDAW